MFYIFITKYSINAFWYLRLSIAPRYQTWFGRYLKFCGLAWGEGYRFINLCQYSIYFPAINPKVYTLFQTMAFDNKQNRQNYTWKYLHQPHKGIYKFSFVISTAENRKCFCVTQNEIFPVSVKGQRTNHSEWKIRHLLIVFGCSHPSN